MTSAPACGRRAHGVDWHVARALAADVDLLAARTLPLRDAVGAVLADDVLAARPIPHYDSSAMDGWIVAGPPPWRVTTSGALRRGEAREVVTGGAVPVDADAVVAVERAELSGGVVLATPPERGAHVRRAGEEAPAGARLAAAGTRLSPAHVAVLAIAGLDSVVVRARPRVGVVLTGDEVVTSGTPGAGRVRDAFDPLIPLAVDRMHGTALPPIRVGDDPRAIADAVTALACDVVVTVGGTGRSRADRLRESIQAADVVFDGVAMRPGHPALLARLPDGRPLLALPGNPLAAVAVLLSFLPPILDGLTGADRTAVPSAIASEPLEGWAGGTALIPCTRTLVPAAAVRPNMLRGLAASALLAVVPAGGAAPGEPVQVLPLPW